MEQDINDVFETIACSEELINKNGFNEGLKKGEESGLKEGYHYGYHRGINLGKEVGFYSGFVEGMLSRSTSYSRKVKALLIKLQTALESFPRENKEDAEFDVYLQNLRSLFKTICALLKLDSSLPIDASSLKY